MDCVSQRIRFTRVLNPQPAVPTSDPSLVVLPFGFRTLSPPPATLLKMAGSLLPLPRALPSLRSPSPPSYCLIPSNSLPLKSSSSSFSSFPSPQNSRYPNLLFFNPLRHSLYQRFKPTLALDSEVPRSVDLGSVKRRTDKSFEQWDSLTAKFSGAANVPFLLLQLPQIILNARNLLAGNQSALLAVPWLGMLTGLLGNLSLVSYFAKKREKEAILVQTLGAISTYVIIAQLAAAHAMPLPHFVVTSVVVVFGLILNFMNYFGFLSLGIWRFWEDFITVGGLCVLPQVMWSTFVPLIPNSILPGAVAFVGALITVVMARTGKLSEKGVKVVGSISGWTATLLFMWMPIAQMWTNILNPDNIKGLSAFSMLLAMIGNGLMIPRALFIRDLMWFTGSSWGSFLLGWGNLLCMYCFNSISREFFLAATLGLCLWIGIALWRDTKAYGYSSPFKSLKELAFGL